MPDRIRRDVAQLDRLDVPDLTGEIERRIATGPSAEMGAPGPRTPLGRAALSIAVVLTVIAGWLVLIRVLPDAEAPSPAGTSFPGSLVLGVGDEGGTRMYVVQPDGTGYRDGGEDGTALRIDGADVAISPDGTRLAFVRGEDGESGLWVSNPDGSDAVRLTEGSPSTFDSDPAWSPDGAQVVFSRNRAGHGELFIVDADGTDLWQITTNEVGQDLLPAWSPDGGTVVFTRNSGGPIDLWLVNSDGTNVRQLTHFDRQDGGPGFAAWSPDGTSIAFSAPAPKGDEGIERHDRDLYVVDVAGTSAPVRVTESPRDEISQAWSPDSKLVAFLAGPKGVLEFGYPDIRAPYHPMMMDVSSGQARELTAPEGSAFYGTWLQWPAGGTGIPPAPERSPVTESVTPSVSEIRLIDPRVTATIPVGRFPTSVAVGQGAVWATVDNADGGPEDHLLVRIDPTTNDIADSLRLPEAGDLAVGDGAVWVLSRGATEGAVRRVDPSTNQIVATIPVRDQLSNVAVGEGAVWVTGANGANPPSGEVVRIDPTTNKVVARIPVSGGWPRDLVIGEGSVWAYGHSRLGDHGWKASSLWRIDPITNEVLIVVDQEGFLGDGDALPDNVAVGEGYVWAADNQARGLRIDPATGEVTRFDVEGGFAWPFLVTPGHVWFGRDEIRLLDTETLEVVDVVEGRIESIEAAFDPTTATLWVANYEEAVSRIELG